MARIQSIQGREVLDSRGTPTVEVEVHCDDGAWGRAIVPSGASTGRLEAHELRDADRSRYDGKGVLQAVSHVRGPIADAVCGEDPLDQTQIDSRLIELDGTENKSRLGANALLGVSLAVAHAAARSLRAPLFEHIARLIKELPQKQQMDLPAAAPDAQTQRFPGPRMPMPMTNMISGGLHAGGNLDFQDFMVVPVGGRGLAEQLEWLVRIHRALGALLADAGYPSAQLVADEGGYGPRLPSHHRALELLMESIRAAHLVPGNDVAIALDVAASHFSTGPGLYRLSAGGGISLASAELIDELARMAREFPVVSIEDGLAEDDWSGWQVLTRRIGAHVALVGDDLLVTNPSRLRHAIELGAANAILIKVNQIGTLSETLQVVQLARQAGYRIVVSARSGETEDTTIADLAVGVAADWIKIGSVSRSERLAKYNQLLRIAERMETG